MSFQEFADARPSRPKLVPLSKPVLAGACALIIACVIGIVFAVTSADANGFQVVQAAEGTAEGESAPETAIEEAPAPDIYVHVAGCVEVPGICKLPQGARIAEAIEAAGGFTAEAACESVNLAREVQDGEQIIVASAAEAEAGAAGVAGAPAASSAQGSAQTDGRVNINAATEAELQTISGIGPAKAQKIIAYRESNGPFKTVEDLCNVSGIGAKTLESIRNQISVG